MENGIQENQNENPTKPEIFPNKGGLFINTEEEQNGQEDKSNSLYKSYGSGEFQTPMNDANFGNKCLSNSFLKRLEGVTPVSERHKPNIQYDYDGVNLMDELNAAAPEKDIANFPGDNNANMIIEKKSSGGAFITNEDFSSPNDKMYLNQEYTNKISKLNTASKPFVPGSGLFYKQYVYPPAYYQFNPSMIPEKKSMNNYPETKPTFDKPNINNEEEYIFEKFGKNGWECCSCNNFNFQSRTVCNRCGKEKDPKSKKQLKYEAELAKRDNSKKVLIERKGDWACPKCKNLNFSFRLACNRCKLPKPANLNTGENYKKPYNTFRTQNKKI